MKRFVVSLACALACLFSGSVALAGSPSEVSFSFTQVVNADIPDNDLSVYRIVMSPDIAEITSIELDINGLFHADPEDLDIFLISPFGDDINIMTDLGDGDPLLGVNLTFSDSASAPPPSDSQIFSGTYQPEGLTTGRDSGLSTFVGGTGGNPLPWYLVVIDDSAGGSGQFESWTLRGTYVPEPVTLSLLALGALTLLRRKRR
ncbi:MAG: PEP-CTERM sorting domain-containing protein [Planctomycetes bacterium]|nr:PEP-CTERM sorting domain-containing protein [Planctomycetota bacterium]